MDFSLSAGPSQPRTRSAWAAEAARRRAGAPDHGRERCGVAASKAASLSKSQRKRYRLVSR